MGAKSFRYRVSIHHPLEFHWQPDWKVLALGESTIHILVGGWTNPFEEYARQIGSFPQVGVNIKNIWNHHPNVGVSKNRGTPNWMDYNGKPY